MRRRSISLAARYASLIILAAVFCGSFVWMLMQSLQSTDSYYRRPPTLPSPPHWENYAVLLTDPTFVRAALNSLGVAAVIACLQVIASALAGYAFAVLDFRGKRAIFIGVITTLMVPSTATIIPLFMITKWLGIINTYPGLVLPFIFTAFGIFLMRQFFLTLPSSLRDAAVMDGANQFQVFALIYFPLALPGAATLGVLAFVAYWNSLLWPLVAISSTELATLPLRIALLLGNNSGQPNVLMAAATLSIVPVLIVFAAMQRYYVQGLVMTGIK